MLGPTLASLHNVAFYCGLMANIRRAIDENRLETMGERET
jgi:tRNA-guanine family transglycosylase